MVARTEWGFSRRDAALRVVRGKLVEGDDFQTSKVAPQVPKIAKIKRLVGSRVAASRKHSECPHSRILFWIICKMEDGSYLCPGDASRFFKVSTQTLRNWADSGQIPYRVTPGGHYRYRAPSRSDDDGRRHVIYARVSSSKQRADLERQIDFLQSRFPGYDVISDIGSGVNFGRRGLLSILDGCLQGTIREVVVAYRDRLARIGFSLVERVIKWNGSILTVVEDRSCDGCPEELAEDVMAVLTHFTAKHHGRRSYVRSEDPNLP